MSATLTVGNLTVTGNDHKELFSNMASYQEVFDNTKCGKCGCEQLRYVTRQDQEENTYYEIRCTNIGCLAKLAFGAHKKTETLFPKRKYGKNHEKAGEYLPHNGWLKWNPETKQEE